MAQLMTLMDNVPHLGGMTISLPNTWTDAVKAGWKLVTVTSLPNGSRVGYFQKSDPVIIRPQAAPVAPDPDVIVNPRGRTIRAWFKEAYGDKIRLRAGEVRKAFGNFGLPSYTNDLKKLVDNGLIKPMNRVNGCKQERYNRDKIMDYITENCTEATT